MKLKIYFDNAQNKENVGYKLKILIRHAIIAALDYERFENDCEISVSFTDNEGIRELNKTYRNIDRATDVLSFPMINDDDLKADTELTLGDVVISLERARAQAEEFGHSFEREVAFLCVHSVLHLLGYDHERGEADDIDMRRRQSEIVESLGLGVKKD